jgi:hypothetical protein
MALSDDQRALLRLLAKREEGYEDIAALKGLSVEEVRAEVRDALAGLDATDEEAAPPLPPSPAPERPERSPEPPSEPAAPRAATEAAPEPPRGAPRPQAGGARLAKTRPALPAERRRLLLLTGGALGIVAVVLAAIALIGDGEPDSDSSVSGPGSEAALAESPAATNKRVTRAVLLPVDGGEAEGLAIFGRSGKQVRLGVAAKGLDPAGQGKAYVMWLADGTDRMVPVTPVEINESGEIAAQYPISPEVLVSLAQGVFDEIDISLVSASRYKAAFAKARKAGTLPTYTGLDVLRGEISGPIVDAARRSGG